jgi:LysM repeat protein
MMLTRKTIPLLLLVVVLFGSFFFVAPQVTRAECGVYHTVVAGQNLFRISLRYGVSMHDIAAVNGIRDIKVIFTGQRLFIPCVGVQGQYTGQQGQTYTDPTAPLYIVPDGSSYSYSDVPPEYVTLTDPSYPSTVTGAPIYAAVDCAGFRATSPLDGLVDGVNTFYWDAPVSIDSIALYQVVVLDDRGTRVATFMAGAQTLRTNGDTSFSTIGGRSRFSWYVTALVNGNETCRTQVTVLNRQWNDSAGLSPS